MTLPVDAKKKKNTNQPLVGRKTSPETARYVHHNFNFGFSCHAFSGGPGAENVMARVYQLRMYTGKVKIKMLASKTETAVKDMPSNYQCPYIAHFAHPTYTTLEIMLRCRNGHITFTLYMYRLKGTLCNTKPAAMPSCSVCVCVIAKLKSGSVDQGRICTKHLPKEIPGFTRI